MKYLKAKGIRFPEDLSITGFDDNLYAQLACPSLTTIHQDIFQRGTIAAEYLFKMIDGWNPKTTNLSLPVIPPMTVQLYKALRDICHRISRSNEPGAICIIYKDFYRRLL